MSRKNELLIRVYIVFAAFVLFAGLILWRVVKITLQEGDKWREKGGKHVKYIETDSDRGNIYDINGNLLSTSLPFFDIKMDVTVVKSSVFDAEIDSLAFALAQNFNTNRNVEIWKKELLNARKVGNKYFHLFNNVNLDELELLKSLPILRRGQYGGGLIVKPKNNRDRPYRNLAKRTIGLDRESGGKIGIEGAFDRFLKGPTDKVLMKRLPGDIWIPAYDPTELGGKKGDDVVTTLDMAMQDIVHQELNRALVTQEAKAGTAILMEVETGAIKAIANLGETGKGYYDEVYNYAIGTLSEPGSTFKLPSVLALLEDGHMDLDSEVLLHYGKKKFYDRWMHDSEPHNKHKSTLAEAFELSSNVGIGSAVFKHYGKKNKWQSFADRLRSFGLYERVGIEIEGERQPIIKDPKTTDSWWGTTVPWMGHGYELMQTPLQTLNFYNAVANGGNLMKPYLVNEIIGEEGTVKRFKPQILRAQIASPQNIEKCKQMLIGVVETGTGKRLKSEVCSFAGKTGTTRVNYANREEVKKYNASFVGHFPAQDPKYSLIVMVYEPKKQFYGGSVAGPAFKNIVERVHTLKEEVLEESLKDTTTHELALNVKHAGFGKDYTKLLSHIGMEVSGSKNRWVNIDSEGSHVHFENKKIQNKIVPDVRGMGLRDATYVLENLGMNVEVKGIGKVSKQSIKPGTQNVGQKIEILLN